MIENVPDIGLEYWEKHEISMNPIPYYRQLQDEEMKYEEEDYKYRNRYKKKK